MQVVNSPYLAKSEIIERLTKSAQGHSHFALAIAATALSDIDGISAAGSTPAERRQTAQLDADILYQSLLSPDSTIALDLPTSPRGITSPVVITSACLALTDSSLSIYDCGTFDCCAPGAPHIVTPGRPAQRPSLGALPLDIVRAQFACGLAHGASVTGADLICLAECVPGGTSTAALVLTLLGIDALAKGSSSLPDCGGDFKQRLLQQELDGLCKNQNKSLDAIKSICQSDPLQAIALAGDAMQAFACGYLLAASRSIESRQSKGLVIAAGGTQMLAVWTLLDKLTDRLTGVTSAQNNQYTQYREALQANFVIITTSYVADDVHASVGNLARLCQAPFISVDLGLEQSRHAGLRAYTEGNVKEGVGAGAAFAIASRHNSAEAVINKIDKTYDRLVKKAVSTS